MRVALSLAGRMTVVVTGIVSAVAGAAANSPDLSGFFDDFKGINRHRWYISDGWVNGTYQNCTWTRNNIQVRNGVLQLRLTRQKNPLRDYRCAEIRTQAALGFGVYEARIRAAAGSGLNSAMFTYSGPPLTPVHDELDFEVLGRDPQKVQLNYYVGGRGGHERVQSVGNDASQAFNIYALDWRPDSVKWFINGRLVRTSAGGDLPTTRGQFLFSLWAGASSQADWLGRFDPTSAPVSMEIDWVAYTPLGRRCIFPQSITCRGH